MQLFPGPKSRIRQEPSVMQTPKIESHFSFIMNSKFLIKSHLDNLKGTNFLISKIHAQLQTKTKVHLFKEGQTTF